MDHKGQRSRLRPRRVVDQHRNGEDSVVAVDRLSLTESSTTSSRRHSRRNPCRICIARVLLVVLVVSLFWWNFVNTLKERYRIRPYHYNPLDRRQGTFPRLVQYLSYQNQLTILDPNARAYEFVSRTISLPRWQAIARQKRDSEALSRDYEYKRADPFETKDCRAQYDWQLASYPTCNTLHELDLTDLYFVHPRANKDPSYTGAKFASRLKQLSNGYWRDVWAFREIKYDQKIVDPKRQLRKVVLKTMRYQHDFIERNYDRHRRDALVSERLTKSKYVVDIYSACGNSGLFEYGDGGDIVSAIWSMKHNLTRSEKLDIATQAASGLADLHNSDKEGQASIAHTDISPTQFIKIDGIYKINDFNRARFIRWNVKKNEACGYTVEKNPGRNRAPEEYMYKSQSEKVDVYSLGNIYYMLLQQEWPFSDVEEKEAKRLVQEGFRPTFDVEVWNSTHPIDMSLKEAMIMCHEQGPEARATARQVEMFLKAKLLEIE